MKPRFDQIPPSLFRSYGFSTSCATLVLYSLSRLRCSPTCHRPITRLWQIDDQSQQGVQKESKATIQPDSTDALLQCFQCFLCAFSRLCTPPPLQAEPHSPLLFEGRRSGGRGLPHSELSSLHAADLRAACTDLTEAGHGQPLGEGTEGAVCIVRSSLSLSLKQGRHQTTLTNHVPFLQQLACGHSASLSTNSMTASSRRVSGPPEQLYHLGSKGKQPSPHLKKNGQPVKQKKRDSSGRATGRLKQWQKKARQLQD